MIAAKKRGKGSKEMSKLPGVYQAGPTPKKTSKVQTRPLGSSLRHKPTKR